MRKVVAGVAFFFVLLLVFLPAVVDASPGKLVATSGVPMKLYGDSTVKSAKAALLVRGDVPVSSLKIDAARLDVEHVRVTTQLSSATGPVDPLGSQSVERQTQAYGPTQATLVSAGPQAILLAQGAEANLVAKQPVDLHEAPAAIWKDSAAQVGLLITAASVAPETPSFQKVAAPEVPLPGALALPAGTYEAGAAKATASLQTLGQFLVSDAIMDLSGPNQRLTASHNIRDEPGSVWVPAADGSGTWNGPGTHRVDVVDYYILHPLGATLSVQADQITLYAPEVLIVHHGFLGLPWADGSLQMDNKSVSFSGEQVILGGDLRLKPIGFDVEGAPSLTLLGDGEIATIQVGVATTTFTHTDVAVAATGAAAGIGLLAAAIYFWPTLKYAATAIVFPLYARVPKENTLDHKGRELLYDLIKNEPGVSTNQLAKEVPFGWSTLTYHLRVLERNEAIVSVRDGRYKRFFDRASGRFSNGRKYILAVLKNDATLGIAKFIRTKPGASQKEVAGNFQLSPSSVHWHVERLNEVGLVSKVREAHNVKYYPGEAWDHITVDDLKGLASEPTAPAPAAAASEPSGAPAPTPTA